MTFAKLIERIVENVEPGKRARVTRKAARDVLFVTAALIEGEVLGNGRFVWPGFGVFLRRRRKARRILTPAGEPMRIPAQTYIGFRSTRRRVDKR